MRIKKEKIIFNSKVVTYRESVFLFLLRFGNNNLLGAGLLGLFRGDWFTSGTGLNSGLAAGLNEGVVCFGSSVVQAFSDRKLSNTPPEA